MFKQQSVVKCLFLSQYENCGRFVSVVLKDDKFRLQYMSSGQFLYNSIITENRPNKF